MVVRVETKSHANSVVDEPAKIRDDHGAEDFLGIYIQQGKWRDGVFPSMAELCLNKIVVSFGMGANEVWQLS